MIDEDPMDKLTYMLEQFQHKQQAKEMTETKINIALDLEENNMIGDEKCKTKKFVGHGLGMC